MSLLATTPSSSSSARPRSSVNPASTQRTASVVFLETHTLRQIENVVAQISRYRRWMTLFTELSAAHISKRSPITHSTPLISSLVALCMKTRTMPSKTHVIFTDRSKCNAHLLAARNQGCSCTLVYITSLTESFACTNAEQTSRLQGRKERRRPDPSRSPSIPSRTSAL